jgi:asparagine synthase (glutamine-hydrolysing)
MKVDKATSAASIEARSPYMDYRIVEYASQIPQEHLLHSKLYQPSRPNEKYILRKIAEKYLPKSITRRKKKGGMLPLYDFLNLGLKEDSMLILNNQHLTTFFGKTYLSNLISSKPNSKLLIWQREWILWKCLIFSLWYEHYNKLQ